MLFNTAAALAVFGVLAVNAATFNVQVGADGLAFTPDVLTGVAAGDDIEFEFMAKNHTVTQSTFAEPCKAMPNGVNSGFLLVNDQTDLSAGQPKWTITVENADEPLWFYCRQKTPAVHCERGMVLSVNPTAEKSHEAFVAAAAASGAQTSESTDASGAAAAAESSESAPEAALGGEDANGARSLATGSAASLLAIAGVISFLL